MINKLWDRIEAALAIHAPAVLASLNPPASVNEIARTERLLKSRLPTDVRATYLRHDGQSEDSIWMFEGWQWLPLARVRQEWKLWMECLLGGYLGDNDIGEDGVFVRNNAWNRGWIPLTHSGAYDHHCLDLAPGPRGRPGQIFLYWSEDDQRPIVARSFGAWLSQFADDLEAGELVVHEKHQSLHHRDALPFSLSPCLTPEMLAGFAAKL